MIKFTPTDKVNGIPMSKNVQANIKGIMNNTMHIHHSHVSGDIIGYAPIIFSNLIFSFC